MSEMLQLFPSMPLTLQLFVAIFVTSRPFSVGSSARSFVLVRCAVALITVYHRNLLPLFCKPNNIEVNLFSHMCCV